MIVAPTAVSRESQCKNRIQRIVAYETKLLTDVLQFSDLLWYPSSQRIVMETQALCKFEHGKVTWLDVETKTRRSVVEVNSRSCTNAFIDDDIWPVNPQSLRYRCVKWESWYNFSGIVDWNWFGPR